MGKKEGIGRRKISAVIFNKINEFVRSMVVTRKAGRLVHNSEGARACLEDGHRVSRAMAEPEGDRLRGGHRNNVGKRKCVYWSLSTSASASETQSHITHCTYRHITKYIHRYKSTYIYIQVSRTFLINSNMPDSFHPSLV